MPKGIYTRGDVKTRLYEYTDKNGPIPTHRPELGPCWIFKGVTNKSNGYSNIMVNGKRPQAHKVSWELVKGPVPDGLVLDHLCRVRNCVNPNHLEPVTTKENLLRGTSFSAENAKKKTCPRGHEYSKSYPRYNGNGFQRYCQTCTRARARSRRNGTTVEHEISRSAVMGLVSRGWINKL